MHTYAMEMEVETNTTKSTKPCWFLTIPHETHDIIASFLIFDDIESEQEFIERTKKIKIDHIPESYLKHFLFSFTSFNIFSGYCPNNTTIAILINQTLIIIDKKNNQKLYTEQLNTKFSSKIAISHDANIFATINLEWDFPKSGFTEVMHYKNILSIKNIISQKTKIYDIPDSLSVPSQDSYPAIAFNKQGTHIILHGNDYSKITDDSMYAYKDPIQHHMIFPLTVNTPDQSADNKKTLEKYFKQQMICKNFSK